MGLVIGNTEIRGVSIGTTGEQYVLPIAGENTLGGVKINGNNLAIAADGTLSAGGGGSYEPGWMFRLIYGFQGSQFSFTFDDGTIINSNGIGLSCNGIEIPKTPYNGSYEFACLARGIGYTSYSNNYDFPYYTAFCKANVKSVHFYLRFSYDESSWCHAAVNGISLPEKTSGEVGSGYRYIDENITLTSDTILDWQCGYCLHPSTLITLSDKKQVQLKDLKVGDKVLALDENGNEVEDIVDACDSQSTPKYGSKTDIWRFLDGTKIMTINPHEFYSVDEKKFKYIAEFNIGERMLKQDGSTTQLISHETIEGKQQHMTLFTKRYNTYFANGILTGNRRSIKINI